ncbi:MAG: hypothetical protein V7K48_32375 [Nostoc sp.]
MTLSAQTVTVLLTNVRYYETNWPLIFPQAPFTLQGTISVEF